MNERGIWQRWLCAVWEGVVREGRKFQQSRFLKGKGHIIHKMLRKERIPGGYVSDPTKISKRMKNKRGYWFWVLSEWYKERKKRREKGKKEARRKEDGGSREGKRKKEGKEKEKLHEKVTFYLICQCHVQYSTKWMMLSTKSIWKCEIIHRAHHTIPHMKLSPWLLGKPGFNEVVAVTNSLYIIIGLVSVYVHGTGGDK